MRQGRIRTSRTAGACATGASRAASPPVKPVFIAISIPEVNVVARADALRRSVAAALWRLQQSAVPSDRERAEKAAAHVAAQLWPGARVRDVVATPADASARRYLR